MFFSLSLCLYIYIYIYIDREREREIHTHREYICCTHVHIYRTLRRAARTARGGWHDAGLVVEVFIVVLVCLLALSFILLCLFALLFGLVVEVGVHVQEAPGRDLVETSYEEVSRLAETRLAHNNSITLH